MESAGGTHARGARAGALAVAVGVAGIGDGGRHGGIGDRVIFGIVVLADAISIFGRVVSESAASGGYFDAGGVRDCGSGFWNCAGDTDEQEEDAGSAGDESAICLEQQLFCAARGDRDGIDIDVGIVGGDGIFIGKVVAYAGCSDEDDSGKDYGVEVRKSKGAAR